MFVPVGNTLAGRVDVLTEEVPIVVLGAAEEPVTEAVALEAEELVDKTPVIEDA